MKLNATTARAVLASVTRKIVEKQTYLGRLDATIGDGDHGDSIARGVEAAFSAAAEEADVPGIFRRYGRTVTSQMGGASGPLFGSLFVEIGKAMSDDTLGSRELYHGLTNAIEKIQALGGAKPGDKTMIDALVPAADRLGEAINAGTSEVEALAAAVAGAEAGVASTKDLAAAKGRSRFVGDGSLGHQDPGATSCLIILQALTEGLRE